MRAGMGGMKLPPSEFWNMTPNDFWAIHDQMFEKAIPPLTRAELEDMMRRNPD